ncbi:aminopeptidase [Anaerolentibacter hominis]|uniref:aminopeptidase n=1 Tax=Anaerolentibacter hominis TaxID=3079009 RepID=UPI0031B89443
MERKNAWSKYDDADLTRMQRLCDDYRHFLDVGKTERECVKETIRLAEQAGYVDIEKVRESGRTLAAGDKVYAVCMGKAIILYQIGEEPMEQGMNILGAHIDSPRLDLKQNPLYEDSDMAYLDTHYYGGVKKYQWVTIPLAIHGIVAQKDGRVIQVNIGEAPEDPVFGITDLLIHLAGAQMDKKGAKVIEGEDLDILIGSRPVQVEEEKATVRDGILKILKDRYRMEEEDFLSAELEAVPAGKAREFGLDRSMIMAYGQDDRVCAFTSLAALLELSGETLKRTACCILVDKEEIGSVGATGMQSRFFENATAEVMEAAGVYTELRLRRALSNSRMLSSDVNAAYDPAYSSYFEKKNTAYFGRGMVFSKYTGARGKSGSNDANGEFIARIRRILDDHEISFQTAELGKVDVGGGGTIAYIAALYGMEVIDCGVAVLSMHAPWEVTSKADIYETKKGYRWFLLEA